MSIPLGVITWNVENLFLPGHEPGPETAAIGAERGVEHRSLCLTRTAHW